MTDLRVAGAQINVTVGDLEGNTDLILEAMAWADREQADVLLLPELAITGYPPEDLVLRSAFIDGNLEMLAKLAAAAGDTVSIVGFVDRVDPLPPTDDAVGRRVANAAALLAGGRLVGIYHKVLLPNYGVFDEARYFVPGVTPDATWIVRGVAVGMSVCEDIWTPDGPPTAQARAGARVLLNINGSPYHRDKGDERAQLLSAAARRCSTPVVYLNMVGGQDELVFDGDSMVYDETGELIHRAAQFEEEHFVVDVPTGGGEDPRGPTHSPTGVPRLDPTAEVYAALVTGLRDYVGKNGFREVVIGLSGGIDSALTCAIAVDALGPESVWGIAMPSRYSSPGSTADSEELARRLGCRYDVIPIDDIFASYLEALDKPFAGVGPGVAEENLQARVRGAILMALSNKHGGMVVATGNKSEVAVGYATLYGDMAGGFSVLKDVFKTLVYELAAWRNRTTEAIPQAIIDKPPSAELRPGQLDSDTLPDYGLLDEILRRYVELDEAPDDIVAAGFDRAVVRDVARMVDRNEYKRRQAAPGVRITRKAFGRDRRLPITNKAF